MDELARFQILFEDYIPNAKWVDNERAKKILNGYGVDRYYNEDGTSRPWTLEEYISEEDMNDYDIIKLAKDDYE